MNIFLEMLACASFCLLVDCVRDRVREHLQRRKAEEPDQEGKRRQRYDPLGLPRP